MRLLYIPTNRGRGEKKQGLREREREGGGVGGGSSGSRRLPCCDLYNMRAILVPRGRNPFGQHQGSRPLAGATAPRPDFRESRTHCQIWQI